MSKSVQTKKNIYLNLSLWAAIFLILALSLFNVANSKKEKRVLAAETESINQEGKLLEEKKYWESLLLQHPTYFEGWIEMARIEFSLGNINSFFAALEEARKINPNSEKLKNLKEVIDLTL